MANLNVLPDGPAIVVLPGVWWEFNRPHESATRLTPAGVAEVMANVNRWGGNTSGEVINLVSHSLHVAELVARWGGTLAEIRTAAGHDAHEIVVGDVARPLKIAMRDPGRHSAYDAIEAEAKHAFAERFGLIYPHPEIVLAADNTVLGWEAHWLYGVDPAAWGLPAGGLGPRDLAHVKHAAGGVIDPISQGGLAVAALLANSGPTEGETYDRSR